MIGCAPLKVGITGGIGSGKSTVCRLFAMLGVPVYDTDAEAKRLMVYDTALVSAVKARFGEECYRDGGLDRARLAAAVFGNREALNVLNSIVHPAVTNDFRRWAARCETEYVLVESAILFECSLKDEVDFSITVSAPEELRVKRACGRDGAQVEAIRARMRNQMDDAPREELADFVIYNDGVHMLWKQVLALDVRFRGATLK